MNTGPLKLKMMNVFNGIIENSALKGMPTWAKAVSITLLTVILAVLVFATVMLMIYGPDMNIRYGY